MVIHKYLFVLLIKFGLTLCLMYLSKMKVIWLLASIFLTASSNSYEEIVLGGFVEIVPSSRY